jgi:hypothetical protein
MPGVQAVPLVAQSPGTWIYDSYRLPSLVQLSFGADRSVVVARGDSTIEGRRQ